MKKLKEQGTIAQLPLKISKKVYFVREEAGGLADHGWITVDEARRKNAADRREFGAFQNRYFIDQPSGEGYIQSVQRGATGFEEQPPAPPGGPPPAPEGGLGPGMEEPAGPPGPDLGGPEEPGSDEPEGPRFPGEEPEADFSSLFGPGEEEGPGELPPEDMGGPMPEPEEEEEIEFIVPKRVRLRVEAAARARPTPEPPWKRHPRSKEYSQKESRFCPACKQERQFTGDVCETCHTYQVKPREGLGEARDRLVTMRCPKCGETWHAKQSKETGKWWFKNDDDQYCPECEAKGEQTGKTTPAELRQDQESMETTEAGIIEALLDGEINLRQVLEQDWQRPDFQAGPVDNARASVQGTMPGGLDTGGVYVVDHFKGEMYGPYQSEEEANQANQPLGQRQIMSDVSDLLDQGYQLLGAYEEACPPLSKIRPGVQGLTRAARKKLRHKSKAEGLLSFADMIKGD